MAYTIHLERCAEREFRRLPRETIRRIDAVLLQLASNPRPDGVVKLSGRTASGWRVRVGAYRILYDDRNRVDGYRIKHRREAYRQ